MLRGLLRVRYPRTILWRRIDVILDIALGRLLVSLWRRSLRGSQSFLYISIQLCQLSVLCSRALVCRMNSLWAKPTDPECQAYLGISIFRVQPKSDVGNRSTEWKGIVKERCSEVKGELDESVEEESRNRKVTCRKAVGLLY